MATRQINAAGLALIKKYEGFRSDVYQDQGRVWTQGYGETQGITADTPPITEEAATAQLMRRLVGFEDDVTKYITVKLNDNQFAALVSLTYNCGTAPLTHTLGHYLNLGEYSAASEQFLAWNKVNGIVSNGLVARRKAEQVLFNTAT
jgi:lysozyme